MKFEDLTAWDVNLIKSRSINILTTTKVSNRYLALCEVVLLCITGKGYDITVSKGFIEQFAKEFTASTEYRAPKDERTSDDVIKLVFDYLSSQNVTITKNESKPVVWSQPNDSWYNRVPVYKMPWVM